MWRDLCPNVGAAAVVVTPDNTGTTGSGARELAGWMAGWVVDGSGVKRYFISHHALFPGTDPKYSLTPSITDWEYYH
ncbi:hypothetical protein C0Q70_00849 [Pomacea canaliculata]|uniref:Uncharacterized protein n=1 Tax=Pomacea canaliculata TaxID=400727 RepID=A0A2T7PXV7_POMCA|nr:hypothetical protein C0Q70_00849 [Pomacea canaliculata]